jgi:hypothetical protein
MRLLYLCLALLLILTACQAGETNIPILTPEPASSPTPLPGLLVYTEMTPWEDWSWDTVTNPYSSAQVLAGEVSMEITFQQAYGGFSLRSAEAIDPAGYTELSFWVIAPQGEQQLWVFTQAADDNAESSKQIITATPEWQEIRIPLSQLGAKAPIKRISIQENPEGLPEQVYPRQSIYLDNLRLVP